MEEEKKRKKVRLRLFVWTNHDPDWGGGLAVAIAENEKEAKELVCKAHGYDPRWGDMAVYSLLRKCAFAVSGGG